MQEDYDYNIEVKEDVVDIQGSFGDFKYCINKSYKLKEEVKKAVFLYFSKITGQELPWGTLIGIRPSKKALELLQKGNQRMI